MGNVFEGHLVGTGLKVGIVVGRFNEFITSKLIRWGRGCFKRHGVKEDDIDIAWVPGAFEIPFAAKKMLDQWINMMPSLLLGTVIRGATPHFDYVCSEVAKGVSSVTLSSVVNQLFLEFYNGYD